MHPLQQPVSTGSDRVLFSDIFHPLLYSILCCIFPKSFVNWHLASAMDYCHGKPAPSDQIESVCRHFPLPLNSILCCILLKSLANWLPVSPMDSCHDNQSPSDPIESVCRHFPSLRTADVFPVVASLPPKINVCEPERQNDFRDVKPFVLMLANQIKG